MFGFWYSFVGCDMIGVTTMDDVGGDLMWSHGGCLVFGFEWCGGDYLMWSAVSILNLFMGDNLIGVTTINDGNGNQLLIKTMVAMQ